MPAYVVVQVEIHDPAVYGRFKELVPASVAAYGGRFLARGGPTTTLEGTWLPPRLAILEFPSIERARAWWASDEYAPAKALCQASAKTEMLVIDGV